MSWKIIRDEKSKEVLGIADNTKKGLDNIICDIEDEDIALQICQSVNNFISLLDTCKRDEELANASILATPTGEYRNKLTEINILRLQAIADAENIK